MKGLTPRARIEALIATHEPLIQAAFLSAIADIRDRAEIGRIAELLEKGDIDGAIRAVHLDPAAFRSLESSIATAFEAGGTATVAGLPTLREPDGGRVVIRFDARNTRAEQWLRQHSATLVTRIIDDQRAAIRNALAGALERGVNPRTAALDIVGRVNRVTGRREGSVIGLTSAQERFVANAREELASGDPAGLRAYLGRVRRDRRFDKTVLKALRDEKPVAGDAMSRMVSRYSDSLLQLRGETIARTEVLASLHQAQDEAMRQAVDTGSVSRQDVRRVWRTASDARVRDSHAELNGESAGLDEPFLNGLMYPCDPSGPVEEIVNCRCVVESRIDFLANLS